MRHGQVTELVGPTPFEVETLGISSLPEKDRAEILAFQKEVGALQRAIMGAYQVARDTADQLQYMKQAADTVPGVDPKLALQVRKLETRLQDILEKFSGDPTKPRRSEPAPPGILDRLRAATYGNWSTTYGPTNTHRRSYEIAEEEFSAVIGDLRKLVEKDVVAVGRKLEAAGAPWTPGRRIPDWQK